MKYLEVIGNLYDTFPPVFICFRSYSLPLIEGPIGFYGKKGDGSSFTFGNLEGSTGFCVSPRGDLHPSQSEYLEPENPNWLSYVEDCEQVRLWNV